MVVDRLEDRLPWRRRRCCSKMSRWLAAGSRAVRPSFGPLRAAVAVIVVAADAGDPVGPQDRGDARGQRGLAGGGVADDAQDDRLRDERIITGFRARAARPGRGLTCSLSNRLRKWNFTVLTETPRLRRARRWALAELGQQLELARAQRVQGIVVDPADVEEREHHLAARHGLDRVEQPLGASRLETKAAAPGPWRGAAAPGRGRRCRRRCAGRPGRS